MNLTLKVWRQKSVHDDGLIETYQAKDIPIEASFLEMLDIVNQRVILDGGEPIHFDYDCREGICGQCSLTINGIPHTVVVGPDGVVQWSYSSPPLEVPGANLIFDALEQRTPA